MTLFFYDFKDNDIKTNKKRGMMRVVMRTTTTTTTVMMTDHGIWCNKHVYNSASISIIITKNIQPEKFHLDICHKRKMKTLKLSLAMSKNTSVMMSVNSNK